MTRTESEQDIDEEGHVSKGTPIEETEEDVTKAAVITEENDVLVHKTENFLASIPVQERKEEAISMPRKNWKISKLV